MSSSAGNARRRLEGHVALLAVQIAFGLFPMFGKLAMEGFAPRAVAAWRILIGAIVLFGFAALFHRGALGVRRADLPRLQLCALLGVAVNQVLYLEGLERAPSINAGIVIVLIPVFVFALTVLVRQERLVPLRGVGVLVAAAGAGVLLARRGPDLGGEYLTGNLLMISNSLCYAIYLVAIKPLAARYPPIVLIAWVFGLSAWTVPLFALDVSWLPRGGARAAWLSLGYVVVFATIVSYLLNTVALARVAASTTAFYVFLQPLIVAVAGTLVLAERLDAAFTIAAVLILLGLACVVARPARVATGT